MTKKHGTSWAMGLLVAIALSAASSAGAQAKPDSVKKTPPKKAPAPASSTRLKISKEAPGEVVMSDTVVPPPPPPPVMYEAAAPPPPPPPPLMPMRGVRRPLGFFAGLGGGMAFGSGGGSSDEVVLGIECIPGTNGDPAFARSHAGYSVAVPFGWQPVGSPLGLRFNVGYSRYSSSGSWIAPDDGSSGFYRTRPQIWTVDTDAKYRLGSRTGRLSPYVVGGVTWGHYRRLIETTGSTPIDTQDQSWHNSWGYNAGGGLEYMLGHTGLFVESRYTHLNSTPGFGSASHVPVVVGLTWY